MTLFPARAGMNRIEVDIAIPDGAVPRTRGDEPLWITPSKSRQSCSPHARG